MNNTIKILLIIGGIVVVCGLIYMLFIRDSSPTTSSSNDSEGSAFDLKVPTNPTAEEETVDEVVEEKVDEEVVVEGPEDEIVKVEDGMGVYTAYKSSLLGEGRNVLFFHAGWCPTCKVLDDDLEDSLDDIPADVTILKVDFDNEKDLREKYNVNVQHSLVVVDSEGNRVGSFYGSNSLEEILEEI